MEAGADPWDARTLEWSIPSPPPEYNFAVVPTVHSVDDWWHRKYVENAEGMPVAVPAGAAHDAHEDVDVHSIHMPSPSYFPLIAAWGMPIIALGLIYQFALIPIGALILVAGVYGWVLEPASPPRAE